MGTEESQGFPVGCDLHRVVWQQSKLRIVKPLQSLREFLVVRPLPSQVGTRQFQCWKKKYRASPAMVTKLLHNPSPWKSRETVPSKKKHPLPKLFCWMYFFRFQSGQNFKIKNPQRQNILVWLQLGGNCYFMDAHPKSSWTRNTECSATLDSLTWGCSMQQRAPAAMHFSHSRAKSVSTCRFCISALFKN